MNAKTYLVRCEQTKFDRFDANECVKVTASTPRAAGMKEAIKRHGIRTDASSWHVDVFDMSGPKHSTGVPMTGTYLHINVGAAEE